MNDNSFEIENLKDLLAKTTLELNEMKFKLMKCNYIKYFKPKRKHFIRKIERKSQTDHDLR